MERDSRKLVHLLKQAGLIRAWHRVTVVALVAALVRCQPAALAQGNANLGTLQPPAVGEAKHRHRRLGSILNGVVDAYERHLESAEKEGRTKARAARLAAQDAASRAAADRAPMRQSGSVAVTFRINDPSKVDALTRFLRENGGDPRNVCEDYVEAYVPVALLVEASKQPGVRRMQAIVPPQPKRGPTTSQGVEVHGAPLWHALGFTGEGVKVGVIDTGFSGLSGLLGTELPASVAARCYAGMGRPTSRLSACDNEGDFHGTAVAEALLDVAPDVSLYIADARTPCDMASAVDWMTAHGVQVINFSASFPWDGPGDGTSPSSESPLNTVNTAIDNGIVWVNAAGNEGQSAWFERFQDVDRNGFHEFSYEFNPIPELNCFPGNGESIQIQLRWQGPWQTNARLADLDVLLYEVDRGGLAQLVAFSADVQSETRDPSECLMHERNLGGRFCIGIYRDTDYPAPEPDWIQLIVLTSQSPLESYTIGSIGNPAESANPGLLAVGATPWDSPRTIEDYSSLGPTPDGRIKPDVVGVDLADSSNFALGFPGTSQASPHIAGLAALVRDAYPSFSPREVADYLRNNADRRTYHPLLGHLSHPNNVWGYGLAGLPPIPVRYEEQVANDGPRQTPLSRYFPTADAGTTFSAVSSNPELVAVTTSAGALVIVPAQGREGQATITVTAWFRNGVQATVTIVATVEAPPMQPRSTAGWRLALYDRVSSTTPRVSSTTSHQGAFVR